MQTLTPPAPDTAELVLGPQQKTVRICGGTLTFRPAPWQPTHFCVDDGRHILTLPRAEAWAWAAQVRRSGGLDLALAGPQHPPLEIGRPFVHRVCRELRRWHQPQVTFTVWHGPDAERDIVYALQPPHGCGKAGLIVAETSDMNAYNGGEWAESRRLWRRALHAEGGPDPLWETHVTGRLAQRRQARTAGTQTADLEDRVMPF